MSARPAAFLDRDGIINLDRGYVYRVEEFEFVRGVFDGAAGLQALGFELVIVTNQSGIGRGLFTADDLFALNDWMESQFAHQGIQIGGFYYCPHHPTDALDHYKYECDCRKPAPGLLLRAATELGLDLKRSAMFGDRESDLQAAAAAGVPLRFLLGTDGLKCPAPAHPIGLSTAEFRNLQDAAASLELREAVSKLALVQ